MSLQVRIVGLSSINAAARMAIDPAKLAYFLESCDE